MSQPAMHQLSKSAALDFVELRRANHSNSCYSTHSHDEFSFGVVDSGNAKYQNLQHRYSTHAGVTVTINPGDAHSCNPDQGKWSYRMLFIDCAWIAALQEQLPLQKSMDYMPFEQHLLDDKRSYQAFSNLYQQLETQENPLLVEGLLIEYCAQLFSPQAMSQTIKKNNLGQVQQLIMDQLDCALSIDDFCQLVDLSPFHLIRSFKQTYGQSPHAYQLDQRIKRAKLLLKNGSSLSSTATALGFADQSHFQRNFKKRTALTPRQFQQSFIG